MERKSFASNEVFRFDDQVVKQPNGEILAAFRRQAISPDVVAYAFWVHSKRRLLLHKICVAAGFRRTGIGNALMNKLIENANHRSCRGIDLWVDETNHAARGLYSKHGFVVKELVQDYYSPGRTGVKMTLNFEDDM